MSTARRSVSRGSGLLLAEVQRSEDVRLPVAYPTLLQEGQNRGGDRAMADIVEDVVPSEHRSIDRATRSGLDLCLPVLS